MITVSEDRRRVALHEAGHALMAVGLGREVGELRISEKNGVWSGSSGVPVTCEQDPILGVLTGAAGLLAQSRLSFARPLNFDGLRQDLEWARTAAIDGSRVEFDYPSSDDVEPKVWSGVLIVGASLVGRYLDLAWEQVERFADIVERDRVVPNPADHVNVDALQAMWETVITGR